MDRAAGIRMGMGMWKWRSEGVRITKEGEREGKLDDCVI